MCYVLISFMWKEETVLMMQSNWAAESILLFYQFYSLFSEYRNLSLNDTEN